MPVLDQNDCNNVMMDFDDLKAKGSGLGTYIYIYMCVCFLSYICPISPLLCACFTLKFPLIFGLFSAYFRYSSGDGDG